MLTSYMGTTIRSGVHDAVKHQTFRRSMERRYRSTPRSRPVPSLQCGPSDVAFIAEGGLMADEGDAPNTRISNWTLATGTSPGQRQPTSPQLPPPRCPTEGQS